ncbi:MgtC/SapB family protein [Rhodobacteraceae bacterium 2376]|uniref:Protein MgtC n=1 Tax=Rhabdonatronobacter sediminivivens TaxID=2743469 RepID=A0A7Z0HWP0_9RHOB|nr:MgtC/SapB family protein [Rhabdonatronobacter sediminivivens]NYS23622.1 MgtC/SapB family protein [Rhabdonatronobacter sediminivivens]
MAPITFEEAAINLLAALVLGGLVGAERQWRQRLAGLRTNTLVALGAASFVVFSAIYPDEISPTRVAAQIVSGIGFLGAGIIFREGFNVRGLNTAATLWCSASVGMLAGAGAWDFAALMTGMVVFVNLALRPLVQRLNRQPIESTELTRNYEVEIVCRSAQEAHVRALLLNGFAEGGLHLTGLESRDIEDSDRVEVTAEANAEGTTDAAMETIVGRLSLEPAVTAARWRVDARDHT